MDIECIQCLSTHLLLPESDEQLILPVAKASPVPVESKLLRDDLLDIANLVHSMGG